MYFFIIMFSIGIIAAFASISVFNRGKIGDAAWTFLFASMIGAMVAAATAGIATGLSSKSDVQRWTVTDVHRNASDTGLFYSYSNGDGIYTMANDTKSSIKATDGDENYRVRDCGVTPAHFLPFGSFGNCFDYLYVTSADR